jgi:Tfp pilus assembly protein FimT
LAVPSYTRWSGQSVLKKEMTVLSQNLNLARMAAMSRNTTVTVTLDNNVTDPVDGQAKVTVTFSPAVVEPQRMGGRVTTLTNTTPPTGTVPMTIRFSSLGVQLGANQSFTLTNSDGTVYSAVVTPAGKVTWCPKSTCP